VRRNPKRLLTLIVVMLLLTIFVLGVSGESGIASTIKRVAASSEGLGGSEISVHFVSASGPSESQPWTEEELLAAQPYPLERMPGEPAVSLEFAMPDGDPVLIPGSPPKGAKLGAAANEDSLIFSRTASIGITDPPPYIRYENFDSYMEYPYSTVGVLIFEQGGSIYQCSAASIGNNAIWTAGHCIHGGGEGKVMSTELWFAPAYREDNNNNPIAPFGWWRAFAVLTHQEWEMNADLRYDIGGAVLELNNEGKKISEVVKSLGFAANLDNNRHWFNIGYPADSPFDGRTQQICAAPFAFNDTNMNKPYPVGIGCDMTAGSSGGPWIINFSGEVGAANYLNGNNSYRYSEGPEEMFSPYFGDAAQNLYDELISIASP
jgi:V8-like Glu-specific endopeptidase